MFAQVNQLFLQWLPWLLRMSRPGEKITKKSIMMGRKMRELDEKQAGNAKSLLSNVLDMDDDYRPNVSASSTLTSSIHPSKMGYVNLVVGATRATK